MSDKNNSNIFVKILNVLLEDVEQKNKEENYNNSNCKACGGSRKPCNCSKCDCDYCGRGCLSCDFNYCDCDNCGCEVHTETKPNLSTFLRLE